MHEQHSLDKNPVAKLSCEQLMLLALNFPDVYVSGGELALMKMMSGQTGIFETEEKWAA